MTHRHLEPFLPSEVRNRTPERGRAHAVVVGIDAYPSAPLRNAVHDARAVARILEREYGFTCTLLLDGAASRSAIERAVAAGLDDAGPTGRFLFYFAGHGEGSSGATGPGGPARPGRLLLASGGETVPLALPHLVDATLASTCGQTLLVLDTCYSGQALFRAEDREDRTSADPQSNRRVRQILCSGNPYQPVLDGGGTDHSPFTKSLLDALGGLAGIHENDGTLRFDQLLPHMKQDVERRLRGSGERGTTQSVIGGNLVGTTSRYGFTFVPIVPRIPGETVHRCLDEDPEERIRGLRDLIEDCRGRPERLPATIDLAGPRPPGHDEPPERTRGERLELVAAQRAFLEILASRPLDAGVHERMEATLAARLLRSSLRDDDPAVRHRARRGLRLVGGRTGARARHVLEHRLSRSDPSDRRRAWETLAMLPAARRRLPVLSRVRAHLTTGRLWSGALRRTLTATRPRRLALATPPAALGLLYLVLATSYYVSTAGTTVVLRSGIPGLSALPGAGVAVAATEFTSSDLKDPATAREERLRGVWLPDPGFGLLGRDRLLEHLRPAEAGLAVWRLGDAEWAVRRLHEAIRTGDGEAVAALAYMAFHSPEHLDRTVDALVGALAGPDAARTAAQSALGALRQRHAARLGPIRARLARRIDGAAPARRTALLEALGLLGSPDAAEEDDLLGVLIGTLRSATAPELRERLAEIIAGTLRSDPALSSDLLRELADATLAGPGTVCRHLVPVLARCAASDDEALREVERTAGRIVAETADVGERLSLLRALAPVLSRSPEIRELARSVTGDALRTARGEIRLEAIRTHLALPDDTDPPTAVAGPLAELITSDLDTDLRSRALDVVLEELPGSPSAPLVRSLLTVASGGSAILRERALRTLIELALDRRIDAPTLAPLLPGALSDPSVGVRLEAAKGLVLLGDRIDHPDIEQSRRQAVQVLFRVVSSDDPLDRSLTSDLPQRLLHTSRSTRARFLVELFSHASEEEDWVKIEFGNLVREVTDRDPAVLPSIISPLSERLADDDPAADYVYTVIYRLGELPEPHVRAAVDRLAQRVTASSVDRTASSMRAMAALAASSPDLAARAVPRLRPLARDPRTRVRRSSVAALWVLASAQPTLAAPVLDTLLERLERDPAPEVRTACVRGLTKVTPIERHRSRALTVLADSPLETPGLRPEAARALGRWLAGAPSEQRLPIRSRLEHILDAGELEAVDRILLSRALAVAGAEDPEVSERVLATVDRIDVSSDEVGTEAVLAVSAVATFHPRSFGNALRRLRRFLRSPEYLTRTLAAGELWRLGRSEPDRAWQTFEVLEAALGDSSSPARWTLIANGLRPLCRDRPELLDEATKVLWTLPPASGSGPMDRHLGGIRTDTLSEIVTRRAAVDPDLVLAFVISRNAWERRIGRTALARLVSEHPELAVTLAGRLRGHRRSPFRHVRIAAALAEETIGLVNASRAADESDAAAERWKTILEWLPERRLRPAVSAVLDRLEPSIRHL